MGLLFPPVQKDHVSPWFFEISGKLQCLPAFPAEFLFGDMIKIFLEEVLGSLMREAVQGKMWGDFSRKRVKKW